MIKDQVHNISPCHLACTICAIKLHYTARVPFKNTIVAHFQAFCTYSVFMTHFPKLLHTSQGTETDMHDKTWPVDPFLYATSTFDTHTHSKRHGWRGYSIFYSKAVNHRKTLERYNKKTTGEGLAATWEHNQSEGPTLARGKEPRGESFVSEQDEGLNIRYNQLKIYCNQRHHWLF